MLKEEDRSKLDDIVYMMKNNNEPDDKIQFVVNDFKNKYDAPANKQAVNTKKDYIGSRPGIDSQTIRNILGSLINVGEIAAPMVASGIAGVGGAAATPELAGTGGIPAAAMAYKAVSPIAATVGESLRSKIEGGSNIEAVKAGIGGGLLDLATSGAFKVAGKGLEVITSLAGKSGLSKEAQNLIGNNLLKYTKPIKESLGEISAPAREAISNLRVELGKIVGSAKNEAINSGRKIERSPIRKNVFDLLREKQIYPKQPKNGEKIIEKGLEGRETLNDVLDQVKQLDPNSSPKKLLDIISNIDDTLKQTYKKEGFESIEPSYAQKVAEQVRGILNKPLKEQLEQNLPESKKGFSNLMDIFGDEKFEVLKALDSEKGMANLIEASVKNNRFKTLENLKKLDDLLPESNKFLDKTLNRVVRGNISPDFSGLLKDPFNVLLSSAIKTTPMSSAAILRGTKAIDQKGYGGLARQFAKQGVLKTSSAIMPRNIQELRQERGVQ